MKEMGLVGQSGHRSGNRDWPLEVATTGAMPRVWPSGQVDHHCRGAARVTATCPVDDVH